MSAKLAAALFAGGALLSAMPVWAEPLSLEQAIARAGEAAPHLMASDAAIDAARASRRQAEVRPNPTVSVTADNLVGTKRYGIFSQSEITGLYNQTIERGGKREARMAFAQGGIAVAEAQARVARLDLAAQVERAFYDVIIAEERQWAAQYRLKIETEMQTEAVRRVRGYKDPLFVETRADARVTEARIGLQQAERLLEAARANLASFWGQDGKGLDLANDLLKPAPTISGIAEADQAVDAAEIARAGTSVGLEQSRGRQDYTVSGGLRYLRETNDVALQAGVTIPLGRFDRNLGNIERAQAERRRLEFSAEAVRLDKLRRLAALRAEADAARARADAIRDEVVPRVTKTLAQVREGYNRGGFTFRDVQDAADAIIAAQEQWLAAAVAWRDLQTEIDRISGRFDTATGGETLS